MGKQLKSRKLSYDIIRVLAIALVVLVHVSAYIVLYHTDPASKEFFIGNLLNGISRAGVPMFLLLTGALLLNEDKPFSAKRFYKTSFLWMSLLLVGWVSAYAVFYKAMFKTPFWNYVFNLPTMYPHLWYMFMVVGLYLMIPVLRLFVKRENKNYILGIIAAFVLVKLLPATVSLYTREGPYDMVSFLGKFHLEPVTGFVGYVLTGWYVTNVKLNKPTRLALYLLALDAVFFGTYTVQTKIAENAAVRGYFYEPLTLTAYLYGLGVFVFLYYLCGQKETKSRLLVTLSNCSFGVYIIHAFWLEMLTKWLPYSEFTPQNPLLYMEILFAVCMVVSYVTVWLVSLVPYLKKIFYLK